MSEISVANVLFAMNDIPGIKGKMMNCGHRTGLSGVINSRVSLFGRELISFSRTRPVPSVLPGDTNLVIARTLENVTIW